MNTPIYDNKAIAELLAEDKWQLGDGKSPGRVGGNVLVRYLEHKADDITHEAWEKIELFYATWTSAKNYTNDSSPASNTVVDPLTAAGRSVEKGTFYRGPLRRQRVQGERGGGDPRWRIVSTLFKGAADTEDFFTADDGCQYTVTRKYMIDQVATPTIPAKSSGVEASNNFQLDPESGLYNGYQEIRTRLYQQVPTFYTMKDAFSKAQRTKHLGVRTGDLDDTGAAISPAIPDPTSQIAGVLVEVDRRKNSDCTQDIDVVKRTAIAAPNAITTDRKEKFESVTSDTDLNQPSVVAAPARSDGAIVTRENKKNETGLIDVSTTTRTAVPVTTAQESRTYTPFESRIETLDRNTIADPTLPSSQVVGTVVTTEDNLNDFGAHDIKTTTRTFVAQASAEVTDTREKFQTVAETKAINAAAALTSGAHIAGTIVTDVSRLNEFAKYDTSRQTRSSVPVTTATEERTYSAFETRTEVLDRNTIADPTLKSSQETPGTVVTERDTVNEFGVHDIATTTRVAVAADSGAYTSQNDAFKTVSAQEFHNAASIPSATTNQNVRGDKNELGKFDYSINTVTPVNASASNTSAVNAFQSVATEVQHNAETLPDATANISINGDKNELGKYDYTKRTVTPTPANSGTYTSENNSFQTAATTEYHNAASVPNATANQSVRGDINAEGKFDYSLTTRTPVAASVTFKSELTEFTQVNTSKYVNADAIPDAKLGQSIDGGPNALGKFDYTLKDETPVSGLLDAGGAAHATWSVYGNTFWVDTNLNVDLSTPIEVGGVKIKHYTWCSATTEYREKKVYTVRYWGTEAEAVAVINALTIAGNYEGSYPAQVAPGLWKSVVVLNTAEATGGAASFTNPYSEYV